MLRNAPADHGSGQPEPEVIVIREPVVLTNDQARAGGQQSSHGTRATSCYVSRSCPTCAPCCLALFVAPVLFLLWTLYPSWQQSREINTWQERARSQDLRNTPDPTSDRLKAEVQSMSFASREEITAFMLDHGITYEVRSDGYWIATDRTQQAAVVILQQRWQALPVRDIPQ